MKMKMTKRFVALLMAVAMCLGMMSMSALAAEVPETANESSSEMDALIQSLPEDAVILYQDENAIMYQSKEESSSESGIMPLTDNNYGYAWIDKGAPTGYFKVYNTHQVGSLGVTWKVETSSETDYATLWMDNPSGFPVLKAQDVYAGDGDVRFVVLAGTKGYYKVNYIPTKVTTGMRIMCWTYGL